MLNINRIKSSASAHGLLLVLMLIVLVGASPAARIWKPKDKPSFSGDFQEVKGDDVLIKTLSGVETVPYLSLSRGDRAEVKSKLATQGKRDVVGRLNMLEGRGSSSSTSTSTDSSSKEAVPEKEEPAEEAPDNKSGSLPPAMIPPGGSLPGNSVLPPGFGAGPSISGQRVWTDVSGNQLNAEFVRRVGQNVELRVNGVVQTYSISGFSVADQQLIQSQPDALSPGNPTPPASDETSPGQPGTSMPPGGYPGYPGSGYPGGMPPGGYPGSAPSSGYPGSSMPMPPTGPGFPGAPGSSAGYPGSMPPGGYPGGAPSSGYGGGFPGGAGAPGMPSSDPSGGAYPGYPGAGMPSSSDPSAGAPGGPGSFFGGSEAPGFGPDMPAPSFPEPPTFNPPTPPTMPDLSPPMFEMVYKCDECGAEFTAADGVKDGDDCPKCSGTSFRFGRGAVKGIIFIVAVIFGGISWVVKKMMGKG